jgi:hypothetical protein
VEFRLNFCASVADKPHKWSKFDQSFPALTIPDWDWMRRGVSDCERSDGTAAQSWEALIFDRFDGQSVALWVPLLVSPGK